MVLFVCCCLFFGVGGRKGKRELLFVCVVFIFFGGGGDKKKGVSGGIKCALRPSVGIHVHKSKPKRRYARSLACLVRRDLRQEQHHGVPAPGLEERERVLQDAGVALYV